MERMAEVAKIRGEYEDMLAKLRQEDEEKIDSLTESNMQLKTEADR